MRGGTGKAVELTTTSVTYRKELVAHTGLEPVISALRGQRVNQLHQCAASGDYTRIYDLPEVPPTSFSTSTIRLFGFSSSPPRYPETAGEKMVRVASKRTAFLVC